MAGQFHAEGAGALRQLQQRPVTARNHVAAPFLFDGREGKVEMKKGKHLQCALRAHLGVAQRRVHAVSIRIRPSASLAAFSAASRLLPVASTMAPDGLLSPAGGITSPGRAVITNSATPATRRASSAPFTVRTVPGLGKT